MASIPKSTQIHPIGWQGIEVRTALSIAKSTKLEAIAKKQKN